MDFAHSIFSICQTCHHTWGSHFKDISVRLGTTFPMGVDVFSTINSTQ